ALSRTLTPLLAAVSTCATCAPTMIPLTLLRMRDAKRAPARGNLHSPTSREVRRTHSLPQGERLHVSRRRRGVRSPRLGLFRSTGPHWRTRTSVARCEGTRMPSALPCPGLPAPHDPRQGGGNQSPVSRERSSITSNGSRVVVVTAVPLTSDHAPWG